MKAVGEKSDLSVKAKTDLEEIREKMITVLTENASDALNLEMIDNIISFGPKRCGPNVFINQVPELNINSIWEGQETRDKSDKRIEYVSSLGKINFKFLVKISYVLNPYSPIRKHIFQHCSCISSLYMRTL